MVKHNGRNVASTVIFIEDIVQVFTAAGEDVIVGRDRTGGTANDCRRGRRTGRACGTINHIDESADEVLAFRAGQSQGTDGVLKGFRQPSDIVERDEGKDLSTYQASQTMRWYRAHHSRWCLPLETRWLVGSNKT